MAKLFTSSVGKKFLMAVTGGAMLLFVIGHMVGNLQFFLGEEAINRYGHLLQSNVELLWPMRIGLLAVIALHGWSAVQIARENRAARPVQYANWNPTVASYASRTMLMGGVIIGVFVIYHLLHYTAMVQAVNFTGQDFHTLTDAKGRHDIFKMMVLGFSQPLVVGFYVLAIGMLCLHLSHGVSAMFQSLGLKNATYSGLIDNASKLIALGLFAGYVSIPVAVLFLGYGRGGCCFK